MFLRSLRSKGIARCFPSLPLAVFSAVIAIGLSSPLASQANESGYHIIDKQHLDGDTKWDYLSLDAANRHLFITHGDRVEVFDVDKKQIVGAIPDTHGVHGVAVAAELDRGFTSNGKDNSVTIFALSTLKVIGTAPAEKKPDGIVYDPASKRVFVGNGASGSLTPIDAAEGKSLAAIPLDGKPEFAVVDGKGRLFINLEDKNELVVVDTQKLAVTQRYALSPKCDEPAGLSIDLATERLFVGCHNRIMAIVDANTGKILATPTIGNDSDATVYDAGSKLAFSSNADGTLDVIRALDAKRYQRKQSIKTMIGARTLALDPISHKVYLIAAEVAPKKRSGRPNFNPDTLTLITVGPGQ